ncbi:VCBS repeat-containing protein [Sphingomonas sp. HF-S4]|uniref:VCBS repeat-containing protein n=1 Tax=Sphingomonas agrestis TaxID=3080540 RepID=A0ABU3Y3B4_9SPHN|nr:VCBS repeat-containing protein [Sphingomonas sp. HF-S4]MDV3455896.1 VCBS repeat-containing protein [Sphingomonas sp. HF-S4]
MTIGITFAGILAMLLPQDGAAKVEDGDRWSRWNVAEAAQKATILPVCTGPYQVSSGDVNGDGLPDLIIPCRGELLSPRLDRPANDQLTVYLNPGKQGAWVRRDFTVGFGPYHSAIGDLDGDGRPDLVVPNYQSNNEHDLSILYGAEDRKALFEPASSVALGSPDLVNEYSLDAKGDIRYPTPGLTSAIIADVNGDGRPDIVTVSYQSNVFFVLINDGGRRFRPVRYPQQAVPYDQMLGGPRDIAAADFDGDGTLDLAFSMYESNLVEMWKGDGKGGFSPWRRMPSFGRIPYHLKAGDLDADGRSDIVVGNRGTSDNVVVLRNRPERFVYDGSFGTGTAKRGEVTADEIRDVQLSDLDGDGKLDLIAAARESGKLVFWRGTSKRGFNQAFADRRSVEFPGKGPRGIATLPGAVAVIFYNSSEVALLATP